MTTVKKGKIDIENITKMSETRSGDEFIIQKINTTSSIKQRLYDIGLVAGTRVTKLFESPCGNPCAFLICDTVIALRNRDADMIEVSVIERSC